MIMKKEIFFDISETRLQLWTLRLRTSVFENKNSFADLEGTGKFTGMKRDIVKEMFRIYSTVVLIF